MAKESHADPRKGGRRLPRLLLILTATSVLVGLPLLSLPVWFKPTLSYISQLWQPAKKESNQAKSSDSSDSSDSSTRAQTAAPKKIAETKPALAGKQRARGLRELDEASGQLLVEIAKHPDDPSLHNQIAILYAGLGDFQSAINHFRHAVDLARSQISTLKETEAELRSKGEDDKACQALLLSSRMSVELSAAHSSLARVYDQLGQHDKVVAELDQMNQDIQFGNDAADKEQASPPVAQAQPVEIEHQMPPEALTLFARAQAFMQARRIPEAVAMFKRVLALDPQSAVAHQSLGYIALVDNNLPVAVEELEQAESLDPDCATTYSELGTAYQAQGQSEHAIAMYDKAVSLNPKDADSAFAMGTLLAFHAKYAEAEEAFRKATAANPRLALPHNHLGTLLSLKEDYEGAMKEFQQAIALSPDLASAHYGLGLAYYNTRNYSASIPEFKRALVLNPQLVDAHNKLDMASRRALANASVGIN